MTATKAKVKATSSIPHHISATVWFYTARSGLDFVVESRTPEGALISVEQFRLTWGKIDRMLNHRPVTPAKQGKSK